MRGQGGNIWLELGREAVGKLRSQGRRSFLALLGVMIGSASIVALMSFAHIARNEVMGRFQQVGVDTVQLAVDLGGKTWMQPDKVLRVLGDNTHVVDIALIGVERGTIRVGAHSVSGTVAAVSASAVDMLRLMPDTGRMLSAVDGCNGAVVLGRTVADDAKARTGDTAFVAGYGYRVVGILPDYPAQALSPVEPNETSFVGLSCARRVMPREGVSHAMVRLAGGVDTTDWAERARTRIGDRDVMVNAKTPQDMIAAMNSQMALMSAILLAIGSVSLLVGGVGVMNVMLMSVMERRREIGLRAAIGATPAEIVFIFIVEAVALSVGGGLLGALAGVALTALGCLVLPFRFVFDPMVMVWGTGVAGAIGLLFGIHPALAASKILPVEALRAD